MPAIKIVRTFIVLPAEKTLITCSYNYIYKCNNYICHTGFKGCHGRDRIVVGFTTAYAINALRH